MRAIDLCVVWKLARLLVNATCAIFLLALTTSHALADMPPSALIQIGRDGGGGGFLMTRLGSCYAITAAHVLGGRTHAKVFGFGDKLLEGRGELIAIEETDIDLAVLRVTGPLSNRCGLDYVLGVEPSRLRSDASALVVMGDILGSVRRYQFDVVDVSPSKLLMRPASKAGDAFQGMSGNLVSVDGSPAGMIQKVDSEDGSAWVRRYDDIIPRIRKMMSENLSTMVSTALPSNMPAGGGVPPNLADAAAGARVISWKPSPTLAEHHAGRLLERGLDGYWEVPLDRGKAEVEIELAGGRARTVGSVSVRRDGLAAKSASLGLEIFVSTDAVRWSSVATFDLLINQLLAQAEFSPARARYVKLRIYGRPDDSGQVVAISRIVVR